MKQNNFLAENWLLEESREELGFIRNNMDDWAVTHRALTQARSKDTAGVKSPPGRNEG